MDLASKGNTIVEIAAVMDCSDDTLSRRFADVIQKGRSRMRASVRRKQFEVAMSGNPTMLVWLGKQELNQSDKAEVQNSHKDLTFGDLPISQEFRQPSGTDKPN